MTHELSELNWIDGNDVSCLSELIGKSVIVQSYRGSIEFCRSLTENFYNVWFLDKSDPLIRYAIIDTSEPEEPLPLWGVMPKLGKDFSSVCGTLYYYSYNAPDFKGDFSCFTQERPTQELAIATWNKIRNALENVKL